jgi:hypothetical protein
LSCLTSLISDSQRPTCGDDRSTGDTAGRDLRDHVREE